MLIGFSDSLLGKDRSMNAELEKTIQSLKSISFFSALPADTLADLAGQLEASEFGKDEIIFRRGDAGDAMFVLLSGWVKVITEDATGDELVLNHCGPGQTVGEVALIDGQPRSAGVVALTPIKAMRLRRETLLTMLNRQPTLALDILQGLTARLRLATTYIEKAIEWSHRVARGDYSMALDQINKEHSVVTMSRTNEARVDEFLAAFFRMVKDVKEREESLQRQVQELTIQIDEARRQKEVEELTQSDFFKRLKSATTRIRRQRGEEGKGGE
jgi:CRP-like cAMP-binding protein